MKFSKIILTALMLTSCVGFASAQESGTAAKQQFALPKQGDIALGIDMQPMLSYAGNLLNGTMDNGLNQFGGDPTLNLPTSRPSISIMGKYMITKEFALRANIGILSQNSIDKSYQQDDLLAFDNPLSEAKVIDQTIVNNSGAIISAGVEWRRGYKRIQGFGGANLIYGYAHSKTEYTYGNAITELNQTPSRQNGPAQVSYLKNAYKLKEYSTAPNNIAGVGAHVGVEIFLASHFSIGGEVQLSATYNWAGQRYTEYEGYNDLNQTLERYTNLESPGSRTFTVQTGNLGGGLFMMFYF